MLADTRRLYKGNADGERMAIADLRVYVNSIIPVRAFNGGRRPTHSLETLVQVPFGSIVDRFIERNQSAKLHRGSLVKYLQQRYSGEPTPGEIYALSETWRKS